MRKNLIYSLSGMLVLIGLYCSSLYNYLLFHGIAEIFSIVIACAIFMIAWNSRRFLDNDYLLFIGIGYLFIGGLDLVHTFAYKGMNIFRELDSNFPTQFWIAARYMQSLALLIAPLFFRRKLKAGYVFAGYALVFLLLLLSIFYWKIFPVCFVEGAGLTPFKKISEYLIALILVSSIVLLHKNREQFDRMVRRWLYGSVMITILAELSFTVYVDPYGLFNLVGHYLKIVSFWCIYKAVIETGLKQPYNLLFRELQKTKDELENRVREQTAELSRSKELLEFIINHIPVMLCFYDLEGQIKFLNNAFQSILGWNLETAAKESMLESLLPDPVLRREVLSAMRQSKPEWRDLTVHTRDGRDLQTSWSNVKLSDESLIAIGIDATGRKRAEAKVKLYMDQLERSNRELQDFAFVASHDLQEPLRKIRTFGDLLAAKHGGAIDATGRDYIARMQKAAARMQQLIDSLLTYSRVATHITPFAEFDLDKAVQAALANLEVRIRETGGSVETGELPVLAADRTQITQLFQNLLGNALKFHRDNVPPRVKIYARPFTPDRSGKAQAYDIFIEDNGIGFDEQYLGRIFELFQRLHGKDRYEGVGMGLAICQRIVERHGGSITARSAPGRGATFIVRLPIKQ